MFSIILLSIHPQLVVKTMESLAEQGSIREKTYGKQKVYVFNQVRQ